MECVFCFDGETEANILLVAGSGVCICDKCIIQAKRQVDQIKSDRLFEKLKAQAFAEYWGTDY